MVSKSIRRVLARRRAGEARHPNWSLGYEVGVELCSSMLRQGALARTGGASGGGRPRAMPAPPVRYRLRRKLGFERGTLAGLAIETHTPKRAGASAPTLLYLHGGGYVTCSPVTHRALVAEITVASSVRTVVLDYRKAPEHPFPAAIDDCVAAYRGLLAEGVDPARLVIGGDSAGGGLVLALLQRLREDSVPLPTAAVLLSPWVDLAASGGTMETHERYDYLDARSLDEMARLYIDGGDLRAPLASSLYADLSGLPPMFVLSGSVELLLDQNVEFVRRAREQGVSVTHEIGPDMVHVYPLLADVSPTARAGVKQIGEFIRAHVG